MKWLNRETSTVGIFSAAAVVFVFYLLGMHYYDSYLPSPIFLISAGLMILTITYQCLVLHLHARFATIVLVEIVLVSLLFHVMYQIPGYGLWGSDAYMDMASLKGIMASGFIRGVPEYIQLTSYFPMLHILGAQLSLITGIDIMMIAKWSPSLIGIGVIPLLYLLMKHAFKEEKVALMSALLFASLQHFAMFGSLFIRETIALVLAVCCVYLYMSAKHSQHPLAYYSLSILCLGGTVLAHHLTNVMLIVFLAVHWLMSRGYRLPALRRMYSGNILTGENVSLTFILIGIVGTLTYWITTVMEPVQILSVFVRNLFAPSMWGRQTYLELTNLGFYLPTVRYYFLIYGSYLCYLVFALILLHRLLWAKNRYIETYSYSMYLFICGITGIISFYFLPQIVAGDRFLAFGWLFAFAPLVLAVVEPQRKWVMKVGLFFIVLFMFLNMYTTHPTLWDPQASGVGGAATAEDFQMAETLDMSEGPMLGGLNNLMPVFAVQNKLGIDVFSMLDFVELNQFNWIIITPKSFEQEGLYSQSAIAMLSDMQALEADGSINFNKNYVSNRLAVFKRRY